MKDCVKFARMFEGSPKLEMYRGAFKRDII